jgi:hypothetical protein
MHINYIFLLQASSLEMCCFFFNNLLESLMARVPFNTTIDEKLLLRMKKKALDHKINLNDLIEACWRCFSAHEGECSVKELYKKRVKK